MKVLVIGLVPSKLNGRKSPSIRTLNNWMHYLGVNFFCFTNLYESMDDFANEKFSVPQMVYDGSVSVISLGNEVRNILDNWCVRHHNLPHPSPQNRKLNDMEYVQKELNRCKLFITEGHL